ncbi:hypothetical protein SCYAM73S_03674 [Streptomyces cyaneofuscatus]
MTLIGQVLPGAGHAGHVRLAAQEAVGADLAGHLGDLVGEGASVVTMVLMVSASCGDLAAGLDRDRPRQVAVGDGGGDLGDVARPGR